MSNNKSKKFNAYADVLKHIHSALDSHDDPNYWTALLISVLSEIETRWEKETPEARGVSICVSRISQWSRPNQTRWTAGGGFAWPKSYSAHPEEHADWSLWISRRKGDQGWVVTTGTTKSKRGHYCAFLAAPSGTVENPQGAAMLEWRPKCPYTIEGGKGIIRQMYGLRRMETDWKIVAYQEYGERND